MHDATHAFLGELRSSSSGVRDLYADFNALTLRIALRALFGASMHAAMSDTITCTPRLMTVGERCGMMYLHTRKHVITYNVTCTHMCTASIETAFGFFARRAATAFITPEWLPTPDNVQYNQAVQRLDEVVYGLISQRRATDSHQAPKVRA